MRISEAIVVEGRYDRARLQAVTDALIVETDGFGIFRDREKLALLRRLAAHPPSFFRLRLLNHADRRN